MLTTNSLRSYSRASSPPCRLYTVLVISHCWALLWDTNTTLWFCWEATSLASFLWTQALLRLSKAEIQTNSNYLMLSGWYCQRHLFFPPGAKEALQGYDSCTCRTAKLIHYNNSTVKSYSIVLWGNMWIWLLDLSLVYTRPTKHKHLNRLK